jgi:hypothetical protein
MLASVTVLQTTPWPATLRATATATQVTLDADKEHVLPLYMPSKKDTGNSQKWESPFFLYVKPITALNLVNHVSLTYM